MYLRVNYKNDNIYKYPRLTIYIIILIIKSHFYYVKTVQWFTITSITQIQYKWFIYLFFIRFRKNLVIGVCVYFVINNKLKTKLIYKIYEIRYTVIIIYCYEFMII